MKRSMNILLLGLLLFVMGACSKNDDIPEASGKDARLTIGVRTAGTATKAATTDTNELPGEAVINNLAVVVFSADGTRILGSMWQSMTNAEHSAIIADIETKAEMARIIVLANVPQETIANAVSYEGLYAEAMSLASQSQNNLTMSGAVIDTRLPLEAGDNYIGYEGVQNVNGITSPLVLTRVSARVDLVGITAKFADTKLGGCKVRIEEVAVYDEKTSSRYFSPADWGGVELPGELSNSGATRLQNTFVDQNNPLSGSLYSHYTLEHLSGDTHTKIALKATLINAYGEEKAAKTFTANINMNGMGNGYDHNFIKRNYVYRLRLTFDGDSFDYDATMLSVAVEVVGWGAVIQSPEIE